MRKKNRKRKVRTTAALALPDRGANSEARPKSKTEQADDSRRDLCSEREKALSAYEGTKPPNENKMSCAGRERASR